MPGLLTRARQALVRAITPNSVEGWTIVQRAQPQAYTRNGRQVRLEGWEQNPVLHACFRVILDTMAMVPLETVRELPDGDVEVLPDHDLTRLLAHPWGSMPGQRFLGLMGLHYLTYGNAYWWLRRNGGNRPASLWIIHPENMQWAAYDDEAGEIRSYTWTDLHTGKQRTTPAQDIVHFADLSGESWLFGYPRAAAALRDIVMDREASDYVRQVVTNDGSPTLIFHMHEGATPEQGEAAERRWQAKRVDRGKRGLAAFIPGTVKTDVIGFNLRELEFPDLRGVAREDICAVAGVDPRMIGIRSATKDGGLSGEQYREARRRLIAQAVSPLMLVVESYVNAWLAPEFGTVKMRFSPDGLAELTENELETSQRAISEYGAGMRTLEEARRMVALPEERDPAHTVKAGLFGEVKVSDLAMLAEARKALALDPPEPPKQIGAGKPEEEDERAMPQAHRSPSPDQRAMHWRQFDERATAAEAAFVRAAMARFRAEATEVVGMLAQLRVDDRPLTAAEADRLIAELRRWFGEEGTAEVKWRDAMREPIGQTLRAGGAPFGVPRDLPRFNAAVTARSARLARLLTPTTADQVTGTILVARANGWGIGQTTTALRDTVYGGLALQRAETIARTETIGALNQGEYIAATASGIIERVEWLTQQDDSVRDSHDDQDGQLVDLGQAFQNGLLYPGDINGEAAEVINCRCTLLYHPAGG